tara:strand:- start:85 stop:321 length:237 start_codon:yes stop_codon:yes gene_type:complete
MAAHREITFRLVGKVDMVAIIEELASSDPDDIASFILSVLVEYQNPDFNEFIAAEARSMRWPELEEDDDDFEETLKGD